MRRLALTSVANISSWFLQHFWTEQFRLRKQSGGIFLKISWLNVMGKLLLLSLGLGKSYLCWEVLLFKFYSVLLLLVLSAPTAEGNNKRQVRVRGRGKAGSGTGTRKAARKTRKRQRSKKRANRKSKTSSGCSRQSTTFCPAEKALALKLLHGQVKNFVKQIKRAENHAKIVSKKKAKQADFESHAAILQDAVGGNISAPSCAS